VLHLQLEPKLSLLFSYIILLRQDRPDKKRQDRGQKIKDFIRKLFKKGGLNYEK